MTKKGKKRMGRPPKPAGEKRGKNVTVYLTEEEKERLEALAQKKGVPLAILIMEPWRTKRG